MTNYSKNRTIIQPKETNWQKISNDIYRKLFVGHSGKVRASYHYKTKNSTPMKTFEIITPITKQLSAYFLIQKDINDVLSFIKEFANLKSLLEQPILAKSLDRSIVITYSKCFVKPDGRGTKLDPKKLYKSNNEAKTIHDQIIKMRNQYVAHAGTGDYENSRCIMCLPPSKKNKKGLITHKPITFVDLYNTTSMLNEKTTENYKLVAKIIYKHVENKISTLKNKINIMLSKIPAHKYQKLLNTKKKFITEKDINELIQK